MVEEIFYIGIIAASLRSATPIILAALGETFAERSGVRNLGVEGMMIMGAFISFFAVYLTGNHWLGLLAGLVIGALLALLFAYMSITLKVDQIISGLVITIFGLALSWFLYLSFLGQKVTTVEVWGPTSIPLLNQIPIIGPSLFNQNILTYFAIILAFILTIFLFRTTSGLAIRAVGENPLAADTTGIKVERTRYLCTIFGGIMAGIAGACLATVNFNSFISNMTAGRGWIAIVMVIFGRWRPSWVFGGGLLFGFLESLQLRLQALYFPLPRHVILMTPYLFTLVVLVLVSKKARGPAALAIPYKKMEKG